MITENFDNYKTGGSHKEFNIEVVGTDIIIGNTNMLQESITLDEALCSDNNLKFGCCESSQFSVQVANIFEDFADKELNVSVTMDGVTTKYGTFKVDSDKPTADRVWRVLTCYDKMKDIINANVIDWYKGLTFPMSQKAYRDSFFTYLGIEQVEVSLINDDFMVQGGFTATDTLSGKTIITSICEFNGVFGHINREGKFDYVSLSSANAVECPPYENNSVTYEDYETDYITRVTMRGTASDVGTSVGKDGNEYIITNNPIIYGTEGSDELITALTRLLNKIGLISFRPYSVGKTIGNPCVELGDAITVNTRHQTINSYVIKRTLTGIQALRDKYSATGSKVYPQEVNSIREEISRTQGKMNILTRTVDETKSQIIAIQTDLTDNYLTSTQTQTLISQSASQIEATVTQTITAELPDLIDEATDGLGDRITVVESSYTQLSNEIVMKVKADGTVAQVALGSSAESGSNVRIKGDNIQLDGNVTIASGFKLTATNINVSNLSSLSANLGTVTAGVIQSANYVSDTSGMKLTLSNGVWDSLYFKLSSTGAITSSSGSIGGWTIASTNLSKANSMTSGTAATQYQILLNSPATITNSTIGLYVRQRAYDGSAYGSWSNNFYVRYDGYMYASNANIIGNVTTNNLTVREGLINIYSALTGKTTNFVKIISESEVYQTWLCDLNGSGRICLGSSSDGSSYSNKVTINGDLRVTNLTASRVVVSSTNGLLTVSSITTTKLNYLTDVTSNIQAQINGKLSLSGGTITGSIVMNNNSVFARNTTISTNTNPSSNNYGVGFYLRENTNVNIGYLRSMKLTDGQQGLQLEAMRVINGTTYYNTLNLLINNSGGKVVAVSDPAAWRSSLSVLALSGGTMTGAINVNGIGKVWHTSDVLMLQTKNSVTARDYTTVGTFKNFWGADFVKSSSKYVKTNVENMTDDVAKKILDLNVVRFDYIEAVGGQKGRSGLIAEDVLKILPNIVSVPDNYNEEVTKNSIKNGEITSILTIDYSNLVPYLLKMIQIQQKEINSLKEAIK